MVFNILKKILKILLFLIISPFIYIIHYDLNKFDNDLKI